MTYDLFLSKWFHYNWSALQEKGMCYYSTKYMRTTRVFELSSLRNGLRIALVSHMWRRTDGWYGGVDINTDSAARRCNILDDTYVIARPIACIGDGTSGYKSDWRSVVACGVLCGENAWWLPIYTHTDTYMYRTKARTVSHSGLLGGGWRGFTGAFRMVHLKYYQILWCISNII